MSKARLDRAREKRIANDIVVDCYSSEESAMGWYYYLEGRLSFPFSARCIAVRSASPLKKGEKAEVVAMAREEDAWPRCLCSCRSVGDGSACRSRS
ncbi:MAG TPA: calcium-binding protein [Acidiferrobacterales bacterium]